MPQDRRQLLEQQLRITRSALFRLADIVTDVLVYITWIRIRQYWWFGLGLFFMLVSSLVSALMMGLGEDSSLCILGCFDLSPIYFIFVSWTMTELDSETTSSRKHYTLDFRFIGGGFSFHKRSERQRHFSLYFLNQWVIMTFFDDKTKFSSVDWNFIFPNKSRVLNVCIAQKFCYWASYEGGTSESDG